ncbi:MAG: 7,8-didemethyl-8-hydroxy-5-deazariboflavin synthase CofG [Terriglobales bacterium]
MRGDGTIVPIIPAAGASNLGFPKALARFGGRTALEIAVENCAGLQAPVVVLGSDAERVREFVPPGARVVVNANWRAGQMSSLQAALAEIAPGADFMLYPVDYPLLTRPVIEKLATAFRTRLTGQAIALPRCQRRGGHPVIFASGLRAEIEQSQTARDIVYRDAARVRFVPVATDAIWRDLDSPAAYRARVREFDQRARSENASRHTRFDTSRHTRSDTSPRSGRNSLAHRGSGGVVWGKMASASGAVRFSSYLDEVRAGLPVTPEMARRIIACSDSDLPELLTTAIRLKEQFKPGVITYSRKVFLPLTNLCRDYCGYCIFRRDPGQPGAHTMTPDEVLRVAREGERLGCREALFSLGDKPELLFPEMRAALRRPGYKSTLHYLEAMCELVLRQTGLIPHANPGLMSPQWLRRLRAVSPSVGLMLETSSDKLMKRAAHRGAPDKAPSLRLAVIEAAGRQAIPFTTGILVGIGETARDRVDSLFAIAELHRRYGHIQEVIVQNFRVKAGIPMSRRAEPGMGVMLRTVAVARLILRNMNVQAPPNLSAPNYHELLSAGINDWGGVSPLTPDYINPERPWPHLRELEERTRAAGFSLRQRLPVYPEFLEKVAEAGGLAAQKTRAAADAEGYARGTSSAQGLPANQVPPFRGVIPSEGARPSRGTPTSPNATVPSAVSQSGSSAIQPITVNRQP